YENNEQREGYECQREYGKNHSGCGHRRPLSSSSSASAIVVGPSGPAFSGGNDVSSPETGYPHPGLRAAHSRKIRLCLRRKIQTLRCSSQPTRVQEKQTAQTNPKFPAVTFSPPASIS